MKTSRNLLVAATLIICGTSVSVNANAQTTTENFKRHEIGVTVGYGPTSQLFDGIANFATMVGEATISSIVTGGTHTGYTYSDTHELPVFSLEYYYHVNPIVGIGGYVAYTGSYRDMYDMWTDKKSGNVHKDYCGKARHHNVSFIPTLKFNWLNREHVSLYSKTGLGITIMHETHNDDRNTNGVDQSSTKVIPNIQLTFVGCEVGNQTWRGFAELGLGEQGTCAGVRYKF